MSELSSAVTEAIPPKLIEKSLVTWMFFDTRSNESTASTDSPHVSHTVFIQLDLLSLLEGRLCHVFPLLLH
jgi:hypothetical protein